MKRYLHYSRKERGSHSAEVLVNVVKKLSCKIQKITLRVSQKLHSDYSQVKIALPSFQNQNRSRLSCSYAIAMLLLVLKITLAQSYTISIKFWDLLSGTSNQAIFLCQDTNIFFTETRQHKTYISLDSEPQETCPSQQCLNSTGTRHCQQFSKGAEMVRREVTQQVIFQNLYW